MYGAWPETKASRPRSTQGTYSWVGGTGGQGMPRSASGAGVDSVGRPALPGRRCLAMPSPSPRSQVYLLGGDGGVKGLIEVRHQVVRVLQADGQP